ncbi:MAG TPA: hypothetical protein VI363_11825 [Burkholderiales bacterium]
MNPLIGMAENDPDKLKGPSTVRSEPVEDRTLRTGPGGLTLRQIHEQVRNSVARDREAQKMKNQLAQKPSRWQRFVRYVWDKKRG